ncbi:MAG: hypothetical protein K1X95_12390 [Acidimicrobiia bacterium]|nr:hypothetical protein [Acidimicrobiia bacterium]
MEGSKRRFRLGIALLVVSFLPYLLMLGLVAASDDQGSWVWVVMILWGASLALWYVGLFLLGPTVYRQTRDKVKGWIPHRHDHHDPAP